MNRVLESKERVIVDEGYIDDLCITLDTLYSPIRAELNSRFRARNETGRKQMKKFAILRTKFRHDRLFHALYFHVVAHLTRISGSSKLLNELQCLSSILLSLKLDRNHSPRSCESSCFAKKPPLIFMFGMSFARISLRQFSL